MTLHIQPKTINGFEMYAVMLGNTVLGAAWSEKGARTKALQLINAVKAK